MPRRRRRGRWSSKPGALSSTGRRTAASCSETSAATAIRGSLTSVTGTGLEMIRTLQDHGIHHGIDFHMEYTVFRLLLDDGRVAGALAYDRERGRFRVYRAKAVVLATGGIGRAFKITSNSWEYTGDGHTLAYDAGADLVDMEFVQFHPTGMVWPPSVRGILVTEGVRGEGGILLNSDGERFLFDEIPALYKDQTADSAEEGWRYVVGDRDARRPPELLTRDHVARCIVNQIKSGKGSPHGGVYLDIAWIKEKISNSEEHIRKKLPSMYHQFKELAGLDITKERMEVGPTTHYVMGGVRVDAGEPDVLRARPLRRRRMRGGAPRREPPGWQLALGLLVFGKRAGEYAAAFAKEQGEVRLDETAAEAGIKEALQPLEREGGEGPVPDSVRASGSDAAEGGHRPGRVRTRGSGRGDRGAVRTGAGRVGAR